MRQQTRVRTESLIVAEARYMNNGTLRQIASDLG